MFEGRRVVGFTFAGRQRYMEILLPYLLRERHLIDHHYLCLHTKNKEDLAYIRGLCAQYPSFFSAIDIKYIDGFHYHHFYKYLGDPRSIYLKFDDDICWIDKDAVRTLVEYKAKNPEILVAFANTINNGVCSHLHQRLGVLKTDVVMPYDGHSVVRIVDKDKIHYVADIHRCALNAIRTGEIGLWKSFVEWRFHEPKFRVSINCICMEGQDIGLCLEAILREQNDEGTISEEIPALTKRRNAVVGRALVSHFAFWPQREYLEKETDLLAQYLALSKEVK